jgi:hypothetical protein
MLRLNFAKNLLCVSIGKPDTSLALSMTSMRLVAIVFSFAAGELNLMKLFVMNSNSRISPQRRGVLG